jgi:hypothetical protein
LAQMCGFQTSNCSFPLDPDMAAVRMPSLTDCGPAVDEA